MNYRILGKSQIRVSELGIGCEGLEEKTEEECRSIIDFAFENGVNFLDINSSNPTLRSNLGTALHKYERGQYIVEGHLCSVWKDGQYSRTRRLTDVIAAFEDLITRLQIEYIDIGMIHYIDDERDYNDIFRGEIINYVLNRKKAGIIRTIGISTHNPDIALMAVESGLVDVILFSINAAYDMLPPNEEVGLLFDSETFPEIDYKGIHPTRRRLYQRCQESGVAITVMKAYGAGLLLNAEQSPFGKAMSPSQCLHYCLTRPAVASVFVGVTSVDEVSSALAYFDSNDIQKDFSTFLASVNNGSMNGHCMYCGHCSPCTRKINISAVFKLLDLMKAQPSMPAMLQNHYSLLKHHASECIACGRCLANCPFHVDIIHGMKEAAKIFEL